MEEVRKLTWGEALRKEKIAVIASLGLLLLLIIVAGFNSIGVLFLSSLLFLLTFSTVSSARYVCAVCGGGMRIRWHYCPHCNNDLSQK